MKNKMNDYQCENKYHSQCRIHYRTCISHSYNLFSILLILDDMLIYIVVFPKINNSHYKRDGFRSLTFLTPGRCQCEQTSDVLRGRSGLGMLSGKTLEVLASVLLLKVSHICAGCSRSTRPSLTHNSSFDP